MRAIAIVDGEHYAPVVRAALAELPYEVVGAWLAGGTEKLRGGEDYGVPLASSLEAAILEHAPDLALAALVDRQLEPVGAETSHLGRGSRPILELDALSERP